MMEEISKYYCIQTGVQLLVTSIIHIYSYGKLIVMKTMKYRIFNKC